MDYRHVYEEVKKWVVEFYGTSRWCYTDYFLDDNGYDLFVDQLKIDKSITTDMSDEDIIDHIEEELGKNMTMYEFQQAMGSIQR